MKFRRGAALIGAVATLIGGPVLSGAVRAQAIDSPLAAKPAAPPPPLAGGADLAEALRLEQAIDWHLWYRQGYEIDYATADRQAGAGGTDPMTRYPGVVHTGGQADSALWTGTYLASQGYRYQVATHYLAGKATGPERKFWDDQKAEALSRIRPLIDQYHLLSHISGVWNPEPTHTPTVSTDGSGNPDGKLIDTGVAPFGNVGEGLLFRACIPDDRVNKNPDGTTMAVRMFPWTHQDNYANGRYGFAQDRVYGPMPYSEPGSSKVTYYDCEDGTSRDAYAGTAFGMVDAFDFVDRDDLWVTREDGSRQNLHDQVGADLLLLTHFLIDHNWTTPRAHSKISTSNDLSSMISPLYVTSTGGRQTLLQISRHVAEGLYGRDSAEARYFQDQWSTEMTKNGFGNTGGSMVDTTAPTDSYYKWNLGHLTGYNLLRLEPTDAASAAERNRLRQGFAIMDATTGDDINAHFETVTYALTGEPGRLNDAITHLRQWRDYRSKLDHPTAAEKAAGRVVVDNYGICNDPGAPLSPLATCKPEDKYQNTTYQDTPAGTAQVPPFYTTCNATTRDAQPNVTGPCRAVNPLPVADRTPTDFLWQRPPFDLDGAEGVTHEAPGFDYLLPYWMLRYYTEVAPPASVEPFPAWVGPRYQ